MKKIRRIVADLVIQKYPRTGALAAAIYGYLKTPKKSFSLYGEDLLALELFNYSSDGIYVDIGAFHERWISNTHALSKLGWAGVVVDVENGKLFSFKARQNCHSFVGAVVPKGFSNDEIILYKFKRMSSEYDTIDKKTADDYVSRHKLCYDCVSVPAIPIDTLLETAKKICKGSIRYLNIDVEGADEAILLSINPQDFGVEVVQFEDNFNLGGTPILRSHMAICGYSLIASQGGTHTYVDDDLINRRFPGVTKESQTPVISKKIGMKKTYSGDGI